MFVAHLSGFILRSGSGLISSRVVRGTSSLPSECGHWEELGLGLTLGLGLGLG